MTDPITITITNNNGIYTINNTLLSEYTKLDDIANFQNQLSETIDVLAKQIDELQVQKYITYARAINNSLKDSYTTSPDVKLITINILDDAGKIIDTISFIPDYFKNPNEYTIEYYINNLLVLNSTVESAADDPGEESSNS